MANRLNQMTSQPGALPKISSSSVDLKTLENTPLVIKWLYGEFSRIVGSEVTDLTEYGSNNENPQDPNGNDNNRQLQQEPQGLHEQDETAGVSKSPPLYRHEALRPLSRHHHHALVLAQKLSQANEQTKHTVRNDLLQFWSPAGQEHFREEEEILLPEFAKHASVDQPDIITMLLEHIQIRSFIATLADTEEPELEKLHSLGAILRDHVRREERVIFPLMQETISEAGLKRIAPFFEELAP